jgi:hypothetical protein
MKRLVLALLAAGGLMAGGGASLLTGSALAAAPTNGCPSGYQRLYVPTLTAEGYHLPALIDSPTSGILSFGQPGNNNDYVCGVQLGNQLTSFGLPVYEFTDDQLPA